jgi:hypothetical protein
MPTRSIPLLVAARPTFRLAMVATALALAGCATAPAAPVATSDAASAGTTVAATGAPATHASAGAPAAAPGSAAAAAAQQGQPKPFAEVIKDAKESTGLFHTWQKDDKTWIELSPDQFDKLYFFSTSLSKGLGEKWFFGGLMWDDNVVVFHKAGTTVQLIAKNQRYFAAQGTPEARAVEESFADSLLASAPIVSQPQPERKSILIEANTLLLSDIPGANAMLERMFRQSYAFDSRSSYITMIRQSPEQTSINVSANYALSRVQQPPITPGPVPFTPPPSTVPDVRSLLLGFYYNFSKLPDQPMHPRLADDRIGYFTTTRYDYTNDTSLTPRVSYINRWRLEKKDPSAALSEPVHPIVFWLDRNIPVRYRPTVTSAILEWNKAFERIGYKDAIEVKVQPDDADWETLDVHHASVRWMLSARPMFGGIGPVVVDPRTGEILDADVGIDPVRIRNRRLQRVEMVPETAAPPMFRSSQRAYVCERAEFGAQETDFALDLLEARGEIEPDSPEAEAFALADLKETVMHEIGHVLGLTHNFRASTVYTQEQLMDVEFTRTHGIAGSVMEYNPANISLATERQGSYTMTTLGPYDYWAIEYGYKEVPANDEAAELKRIAARSSEPLLAFAQDDETASGIDPAATQGDLGTDPLLFASRRLALAHELWDRWQKRTLKEGESYATLRRNITRGLEQVRSASTIAAKYIGGVSVLRDHAGSPRAPLTPIAMERQRAALKMLETDVFAAESFEFKPQFMRRMSIDYLDRSDNEFNGGLDSIPRNYDYSLPSQILNIQREVLNRLMSDGVAQRLLDSEAKLDDPGQALQLAELYGTLHRAIWVELKTGKDIRLLRRNLQREHVSKLAGVLLRPSVAMPADARALLRADAKALRAELVAANSRSTLSPAAKAHIAEMTSTLDEALKAPIMRQGV